MQTVYLLTSAAADYDDYDDQQNAQELLANTSAYGTLVKAQAQAANSSVGELGSWEATDGTSWEATDEEGRTLWLIRLVPVA